MGQSRGERGWLKTEVSGPAVEARRQQERSGEAQAPLWAGRVTGENAVGE